MRTILLLAANPKGTSSLRLDEEVKKVEQGLERAKHRDRFRLVQKWAVTDDDLRRALLEHEPEVVHFSGHGTGAQGLAFEDDAGNAHLIPGEALARLFGLCAGHVKCVVLNACYSEAQAAALVQHIDYVIGMRQEMGDPAAVKFATGFYDALGAGRDYVTAYQFGCCAVELKGLPEHLTPVLKTRRTGQPPPPATLIVSQPPQPVGTTRGKAAAPRIDPYLVKTATEALVEYIGPAAFALATRLVPRANNLRHLYELMADEIHNEEQRKKFLASQKR